MYKIKQAANYTSLGLNSVLKNTMSLRRSN